MSLIGFEGNEQKQEKPKGAEWVGDWERTDHDPLNDISTWVLVQGKTLVIRKVHNSTSKLLDNNARLRASNAGRGWGNGRVVATIPANIFEKSGMDQAMLEGDKKFVSKFLNDSDNEYFRTFEGKI